MVVPEGSWTGLLVVGFVGLLKMKSSFSCIPSEFMSVILKKKDLQIRTNFLSFENENTIILIRHFIEH